MRTEDRRAPYQNDGGAGDQIVELRELIDGESERWLGNVYRIDTPRPYIHLNFVFEKQLTHARLSN